MGKKYKVIQFIQEEQPDILAVTETHLKDKTEMEIMGYEWVGQNYERAIRGSRGVGFLIKQGIKYKTINHEHDLMEQGRSIGIEIGET